MNHETPAVGSILGCDVAKNSIVVFDSRTGRTRTIGNHPEGLAAFAASLPPSELMMAFDVIARPERPRRSRAATGPRGSAGSPTKTAVPPHAGRRLARLVGSASRGSSGQGCFG